MLYLGEINDSQRAAWCRTIDVIDQGTSTPQQVAIFPEASDKTTLADCLSKIEAQYGKSERVWVMDRGIPTEETLALTRTHPTPVH